MITNYRIIVLVLIAMIGTSCERAFKQPMKPVYFVLEPGDTLDIPIVNNGGLGYIFLYNDDPTIEYDEQCLILSAGGNVVNKTARDFEGNESGYCAVFISSWIGQPEKIVVRLKADCPHSVHMHIRYYDHSFDMGR